ncbi:MAG: protein kinase [Gemmataceae bacterium]|nr:protein kinase [Gemmataceae bacterium]
MSSEPRTTDDWPRTTGGLPTPPSLPLPQGDVVRLGPYLVTGKLGEGGMGVVLRADDPGLKRTVALKVMRPEFAAHAQAHEMFLAEARKLAQVRHPHVVEVYHVGEDGGRPYFAMPLLEGESLAARLKRGKLPWSEARRIAREVALALAAVHGKGMIHRDVKPANIWLEGKEAKAVLLDFGVAKEGAGRGTVLGTPGYMSPEQRRGEEVDARTDQWALGQMLRDMAGGEKLPPLLERVASRLTSERKEDRYPSAKEVADVLRDFRPLPPGWLVGIAAALLLFVGAWMLWPRPTVADQPGPPAPVPLPAWVERTPAAEVLQLLANEEPPRPEGKSAAPALSVEIYGKRKGGNYLAMKDGDPLASHDDRFFITVLPRAPGYLYVFQVDATGAVAWLWPTNQVFDFSHGTNPVDPGKLAQIPPEERRMAFDLNDDTGPEQVFAVLSATAWPKLEEALAKAGRIKEGKKGAVRGGFVLERGVDFRGIGGERPESSLPKFDGKRIEAEPLAPILRASGHWLVGSRWFKHVGRGE